MGAWVSGAVISVTVTGAVELPPALLAVSVYVVVCVGRTLLDDVPVTSPTPLSMLIRDAEFTLQVRFEACPAVTAAGPAENERIEGF